MRLAFGKLTPMRSSQARIPMKESAAHLRMNCTACHQPEKPQTFAAYDSCIQCHDDNHTKNYSGSKHFTLWNASRGETGASCATCHMPRVEDESGGYHVSHDNSANLRPNEKMLRNVCNNCHGLQFSMNALADSGLIEANFNHPPTRNHPGIDWTANAAIKRGDEKVKEIRKYLESLSQEKEKTTETK
jgi:hypothetical protein